MILSVSRRTDIPAFYAKWFANRVKEGFVLVRNPMNIHRVSRIQITPDVVDCIVFWTKNAMPLMSYIPELKDYKFYFQYTINPYNTSLECNVPKKDSIMANFRELSSIVGKDFMFWRYDPIILTPSMDYEYHVKYFEEIAKRLAGYTTHCVISFVDLYKKTERNMEGHRLLHPSESMLHDLAGELSRIANRYGISVQSCSEEMDLSGQRIKHGCCIDRNTIERLVGYKLDVSKDKNQRPECGCVSSIDIGEYNTCQHKCRYCYATFNDNQMENKVSRHISTSPLLIGELGSDDIVTDRKVTSIKDSRLFSDI